MAKDTAKVTDPNKVDWDSADEIKKGFASFKFENKGDVFIGTYSGEGEVVSDDGEIAEAFIFVNEEGVDVGLWKSFDLNRKMEEIPVGAAVRVEYVADIETKRGLNPMKQYSVKYKY